MLLHGLETDQDFRHIDERLLVSCPAGGHDSGGLFLLDFKRNALTKLYTGSCLGMSWVEDRLIVTTDDNRIVLLNRQLQPISETKHRKLDFHGSMPYNDKTVLIAETAVNAIGCYEVGSFRRIGEIRLHPDVKDIYHINDIWLEGRTLYISMFTPYDKWYLNPLEHTGAIIAVDLADYEPSRCLTIHPPDHIVKRDLFMPHTVMVHEGQLVYCNSMSFSAQIGDRMTIQLGGFTRGLAITENAVFVGQSRMRHVLRIPHQFSNCSLDAGIYVYHPEHRISRFVSLPAQQVYQILVVSEVV